MSFKFQSRPLQSSESVRVKQEVYDDNHQDFKWMDEEDLYQIIYGCTDKEEVAKDVYDALIGELS